MGLLVEAHATNPNGTGKFWHATATGDTLEVHFGADGSNGQRQHIARSSWKMANAESELRRRLEIKQKESPPYTVLVERHIDEPAKDPPSAAPKQDPELRATHLYVEPKLDPQEVISHALTLAALQHLNAAFDANGDLVVEHGIEANRQTVVVALNPTRSSRVVQATKRGPLGLWLLALAAATEADVNDSGKPIHEPGPHVRAQLENRRAEMEPEFRDWLEDQALIQPPIIERGFELNANSMFD